MRLLPEEDRPDRIDAVFDSIRCSEEIHPLGVMVQCSIMHPRVMDGGRTRDLVDAYLNKAKVVMISGAPGG